MINSKILYMVFISPEYIRDTQAFIDTDDMTDNEIKSAVRSIDNERWVDYQPKAYITQVQASSKKDACRIVSNITCVDARLLYAVEIPKYTHYSDLLINLINNELINRGETGEYVEELLSLGFTEKDFSDLGFEYFKDVIKDKED